MARSYVIGSWNNADSYDYSGEQLMGNRNSQSVCMDHYLANGMANTKRYEDEQPKKKSSVDMSIPLEIRQLDKLDSDILTNERMYRSGVRSEEMYKGIKKILDAKHEKLEKKLDKLGFFNENETQEEDNSYFYEEKPSSPYVFDSKINEKMFRVYVYTLKQTFKILCNLLRKY